VFYVLYPVSFNNLSKVQVVLSYFRTKVVLCTRTCTTLYSTRTSEIFLEVLSYEIIYCTCTRVRVRKYKRTEGTLFRTFVRNKVLYLRTVHPFGTDRIRVHEHVPLYVYSCTRTSMLTGRIALEETTVGQVRRPSLEQLENMASHLFQNSEVLHVLILP